MSQPLKLSQSLIMSSQNNNDSDLAYLKQIQELVEKNEKMVKEQEQVKLAIIKQILKLQSILGYGPQQQINDLKKSGIKPTTPSAKQQVVQRQLTQNPPVFGGAVSNQKDELSPTMQTSAENDSRTRDDTKVGNNSTLPTNEVSNPNALDLEKSGAQETGGNAPLMNKRDRIKTMQHEVRPQENVEQNNEQDVQNEDYYTHKQLLGYSNIKLMKIQEEFLDELAPTIAQMWQSGGGVLSYLDQSQSIYAKGKKSVYGGGGSGLSQSVRGFPMARPGAATYYKPDNQTVEIDEDGLFDEENGNGIPNFRETALTQGGQVMSTDGNDLAGSRQGRQRRRVKSSLRTLHTQADILLTQSEMQIYDKFKAGKESVTPRGFGMGDDAPALSQSQRPQRPNMAQSLDGFNLPASKWVPDQVQKHCKICEQRFYFLRRRHHCRQCGFLVCDKCSSTRDYVEGFQDKKQRICTNCNKEKLDIANKVAQYKQNMVMSAIHLQKPRKVNKK